MKDKILNQMNMFPRLENIIRYKSKRSISVNHMSRKPVYIYIHICTIGHWDLVLDRLFVSIRSSGLYDIVAGIRCCVLGNEIEAAVSLLSRDTKVRVVKTNRDVMLYERITLNALYDDASQDDFYALYIHTKGVTRPINYGPVSDWTTYLTYFNVEKFQKALDLLETHDVVGVNLQDEPKLHFSGNFWWTKSSHLKTLEREIGSGYTDPEFWICSRVGKASYVSMFNTGVNHYHVPYSPDKYVGISQPLHIVSNN